MTEISQWIQYFDGLSALIKIQQNMIALFWIHKKENIYGLIFEEYIFFTFCIICLFFNSDACKHKFLIQNIMVGFFFFFQKIYIPNNHKIANKKTITINKFFLISKFTVTSTWKENFHVLNANTLTPENFCQTTLIVTISVIYV